MGDDEITSTIHNWEDLEKFGIQVLTGEACGLGMRMLCDLNEDGKKLIEELLGGRVQFQLGSNWNSEVSGKPAVASVMLPYTWLPEIAAFCLLKRECNVAAVHVSSGGWDLTVGFRAGPGADVRKMLKDRGMGEGQGFRTFHVSGTAGTRNTHVMSGRTS